MNDTIFAMVPVEVLSDKRLTLWHVKVLIALLSFRNKNSDTVWPGREALSERLGGMHVTNISKTTSELCDLGWLVKQGNGGNSRSARYKIVVPDLESANVAESATNPNVAESTTRTPQTVAESATPIVADSARGIEQTIEHTIKSNIPASGQAREALMKRGVSVDLADGWLELRKRKSQPVPDEAMLDTLQAEAWLVGLRVEQALAVCVAQGWAWFKAKWYQDLPDEKKLSNAHGPPKASALGDWRSTPDGVLKRGKELGIEPRVGESERDYRDRVGKADWDARRGKAAEVLGQVKVELAMQPA